jgi:outer membrane lipoprotein-sorting protein
MNCLNDEQLVGIVLGIVSNDELKAHVEQCAACRAKLSGMLQLTEQLAAAHAISDRSHVSSRLRLFASLPDSATPRQSDTKWKLMGRRIGNLTVWQRVAAGGISLSTAVGLFLIVLVFVNSPKQLSAMERMLKAVREVTSYSFRLTEKTTWPAKDGEAPRVRVMDDITYWRAPPASEKQWLGDLHAEMRAWRIDGENQRVARSGEPSFHIKEVHRTAEPGIVVVYKHRLGGGFYVRRPPVPADDVPSNSPIAKLMAIHDQSGEVLRELGTKEIGGKQSRGYVVTFKDAAPFRGCSEVEVWVDADTDLPLEFSWKQENEGVMNEFHITDCRWNIELDPQLFATTAPAGLVDATPPSRAEDIDQIKTALSLYRRLSDGQYPRVKEFDAVAIRDEMLKLGGFAGVPRDNWNNDPTYREIQKAQVGLNWLARVLRNKSGSGYYGETVGPRDADKVLFWCQADVADHFRVLYGDLRTVVLPVADWAKLVPADDAAAYLPEN